MLTPFFIPFLADGSGQREGTYCLSCHVFLPPSRSRPGREWLLAATLNLTADTALAPEDYERQLLDEFVRGTMTIDEVMRLLDTSKELTNVAEQS